MLDDEIQSEPLSDEAALRYRAALHWASQTLLFPCARAAFLLAIGMAKPLDRHEKAMRSVLRWVRSFKTMRLGYPFEVSEFAVELFSDASWAPLRNLNRRSIGGMCCFYRGCVVKAFSRVQQVVALSSCESELGALAESLREGLGLQRISQRFFF